MDRLRIASAPCATWGINGHRGGKRSVQLACQHVAVGVTGEREAAIKVLSKVAKRGDPDACSALIACFRYSYARVGEYAAQAFCDIAEPQQAMGILGSLPEDCPPKVRRAALRYLADLARRTRRAAFEPSFDSIGQAGHAWNVMDFLHFLPEPRSLADTLVDWIIGSPDLSDSNVEAKGHAQEIVDLLQLPLEPSTSLVGSLDFHISLPAHQIVIREPAHISEQGGNSPITYFEITVRMPPACIQWSVQRRYSEFRSLAMTLGADAWSFPNTPFPPRHFLVPCAGPLLEARRQGLETWLCNALQSDMAKTPHWRIHIYLFLRPG